jgi:hypothetical protein
VFIKQSKVKLNLRDQCSIAGVVIQLAIILASLAAMTKKQSLFYITVVVTVISLSLTAFIIVRTYIV